MTLALDITGAAQRAVVGGTLAGVLSCVTLALRGRRETGSSWSAINAPSHWVWGQRALRRNALSVRYTVVGFLTHHLSSMFWAAGFGWLQSLRSEPTPADAFVDAAMVTAVAAVVDLKLVPERLTPGFERRLSRPSLALTYVTFGLGLALGGLVARSRR